MQLCTNYKSLLCVVLLGLNVSANARAMDYAVAIVRAETKLVGQEFLLQADLSYKLSEKATEALQNGVPLFWEYIIKVKHQRAYVWDQLILYKSIRYRLQYHALLNMYRVRNESTGITENFSTLQAALDLLSEVRDVPILQISELQKDADYEMAMQVVFDRSALPLPLRPYSYLSPEWFLSSNWLIWPLKK